MGKVMRHTLGASLNIRHNLSSSKGPKPLQLKLLTTYIPKTSAFTLAFSTSQRLRTTDRKSGSAGMPRPISYAVFCLKKKNERTWIDHFGNPHSEDMHLQERYHRLDRDTLEIVVTIDDPNKYTKPWVSDKLTLRLQANDRIREDFCVPSEEESFNQGVRNPAGGVLNK